MAFWAPIQAATKPGGLQVRCVLSSERALVLPPHPVAVFKGTVTEGLHNICISYIYIFFSYVYALCDCQWPGAVSNGVAHGTDISQGCKLGLVSVPMSSWGNDIHVHMVVANNTHDGSDGGMVIPIV